MFPPSWIPRCLSPAGASRRGLRLCLFARRLRPVRADVSSGVSLQQYLDQCGRNYVAYALQKYGNSYKAAGGLGTSQASIMRRKQKFHL